MFSRHALPIALSALAILTGCRGAATEAAVPTASGNGLTVVELFESQGCSSCPPAIRNVNAIAARKDLLALTFSVTYWDYLGWKDSFGQPAFTARQRDYAASRGGWGVYTPQVVVNGKTALVGSNPAELAATISQAGQVALLKISQASGDAVDVAAQPGLRQPVDLWLVQYDPRSRPVPIDRGENAGRTIDHRNVVVGLIRLGRWDSKALHVPLAATPEKGLASALLAQQPNGGAIIAAAKI